MKKIIILSIILCVVLNSCSSIKQSKYKFGIIYSYHDKDAIIQLYDENGNYLDDVSVSARAVGICSTSGTSYYRKNNSWYFASDSVFDQNIDNFILKLNISDLSVSKIPTNFEYDMTYDFYISKDEKYSYAFYNGTPDFGAMYITNTESGKLEKKVIFSELIKNYNNEDISFAPRDIRIEDDIVFCIGIAIKNGYRQFTIITMDESLNEIISYMSMGNSACANGNLIKNDVLYSTYWDVNTMEAYLLKYNFKEDRIKTVSLGFKSCNVRLAEHNNDLLIINADSYTNNTETVLIKYNLSENTTWKIDIPEKVQQVIFDDEIILISDTEKVYIYTYDIKKIKEFNIMNIDGMKFSSMFIN